MKHARNIAQLSFAMFLFIVSGDVAVKDPVYQKGVQWLLRNQLADGSWLVPTLAVPVQPHTFESGFPHGCVSHSITIHC